MVCTAPPPRFLSSWLNSIEDDNTYFLFNGTLNANPDSTLVNIEQIIPFISAMVCAADSIEITFNSTQAYGIAQSSWPPIFELMTSGTDYCGTDNGRTFYSVGSISFSPSTNEVTLAVENTTIQNATQGMQATWGTTSSPVARLAKRIGKSTNVALDPAMFLEFIDSGSVINDADFDGVNSSPIQVSLPRELWL